MHGAAPKLEILKLAANMIGDEGMRHLSDALVRGAGPALTGLNLEDNKIGDEGMRHLGDALARGAAPALKLHIGLDLDGNPASDAAKQAVKYALENTAMTACSTAPSSSRTSRTRRIWTAPSSAGATRRRAGSPRRSSTRPPRARSRLS